jgi:GntR family transcriptional regulator
VAEDEQQQAGRRTSRAAIAPTGPHAPRSYEPAYLRIASTLSDEMAAGIYRAGDQLPTEPQLRARFGVSPVTVRRAVTILLDRGLVTTTQGKGTFVRSTDMGEAIFRLQELTDMWASDESTEVLLLEARVIAAAEPVAVHFDLPVATPVVYLRRLIRRKGIPLIYQVEHVTYDAHRPLVEAQLQVTSLEGLLRSPQVEGVMGGHLTIQAVSLGTEEATALEVPPGSPAFCIESLFLDYDGHPMSWGRFFCRADQFRLTTSVGLTPRRVQE